MEVEQYYQIYLNSFQESSVYRQIINFHYKLSPDHFYYNPRCPISLETFEDIIENQNDPNEETVLYPIFLTSDKFENHFHFYELSSIQENIRRTGKLAIPETRGIISAKSVAMMEFFLLVRDQNKQLSDFKALQKANNPFQNKEILQEIFDIFMDNQQNQHLENIKDREIQLTQYLLSCQQFIEINNKIIEQTIQEIQHFKQKLQTSGQLSHYVRWQQQKYQKKYNTCKYKIQQILDRYYESVYSKSQFSNINKDLNQVTIESQYFQSLAKEYLKKNCKKSFQDFYNQNKKIVQNKFLYIYNIRIHLFKDLVELPQYIYDEVLGEIINLEEKEKFVEFISNTCLNYQDNIQYLVQQQEFKFKSDYEKYYKTEQTKMQKKIQENRMRKQQNYINKIKLRQNLEQIIEGEYEPLIYIEEDEEQNAQELAKQLQVFIIE